MSRTLKRSAAELLAPRSGGRTVIKRHRPAVSLSTTTHRAGNTRLEVATAVVKDEDARTSVDLNDEQPTLQQALIHLFQVDPRFLPLSEQFYAHPWSPSKLEEPQNHFRNIIMSVLSQQVSSAAAAAITTRFIQLFIAEDVASEPIANLIDPEVPIKLEGPAFPSDLTPAPTPSVLLFPAPEEVAVTDVLRLKSAGLSLRKAEYVKGIAEAFVSGVLTDAFFTSASDQEVVERLVSIRGLGNWSAEMFLMFSLKRWDVLSVGDIGIQRGMSYWLGRNPKDKSKHHKGKCKYLTEAEMHLLADTWRPYRSIGCWFMWRVEQKLEVL